MGLFGFDSVKDMFDGGGAGGSGAKFSTGSHADYRENNPDDDTVLSTAEQQQNTHPSNGFQSKADTLVIFTPPAIIALVGACGNKLVNQIAL